MYLLFRWTSSFIFIIWSLPTVAIFLFQLHSKIPDFINTLLMQYTNKDYRLQCDKLLAMPWEDTLFNKLNFRQNTAIWTQLMHIHNLTQVQDPGQLRTINLLAFITC